MHEYRELALKLACECASMDGIPADTIARARAYLAFLNGDGDAAAIATRETSDGERRGF